MDEIRSIKFEHVRSGAELEAVRVRCGPIELPLHVHRNHSVTAFEGHDHEFLTRTGARLAPVGSVAVAEAGEPHANVSLAGRGLCFSALELEPEAWSSVLGTGVTGPLGAGVLNDAGLAELLGRVCDEAFHGSEPQLRDALLERFLTALHERLEARRTSWSRDAGSDHALSDACRDYLFAHASERVTLADLAVRTGFHPDYLARRFRRDFGMTAHQYLLSARLDLARKLLRTGRSPSRVAAEVGFSDQAHLTRVFKRVYRITPGRYRRSLGVVCGS